MFSEKIPDNFWSNGLTENLTILTDTREQEPLFFNNQTIRKLDVGDYAIQDHFDYTFVDRKSEGDFKSTLSKDNFSRFKRELDRCRAMDCYLFVVVESDLKKLDESNKRSAHKANMKYIYHNMRMLQHEYRDCCQFVFSGNRKNSENLIPKILLHGKKIWNVDLQYFVNERQS